MLINEEFLSLQGEGPQSGKLTYFIRCMGCNLRCEYCDTKYSYDEGSNIDLDVIVGRVVDSGARNVCITGGEPLAQPQVNVLAQSLIAGGYDICLETNGSLPLPDWARSDKVLVSMDIKCPGSGMVSHMRFENLDLLSEKDIVKFIICSDEDYDYAKSVMESVKDAKVYFQAASGLYEPKSLARRIIRDRLAHVTLGMQMHKTIWGQNERGV